MRLRILALLIPLPTLLPTGCLVGFFPGPDGLTDDDVVDDDDDDDNDDDDTTPTGDVTLTAVSPSSGPIVGNFDAKVFGTNFAPAEQTSVYFGNAIAPVQSCNANECTVTVPPSASAGAVQVSLENPNGVGVLPGGFTYTEDISDQTSYSVDLHRIEYLCPDCYTPPPPTSYTRARAYFFVPEDLDVYREVNWGNFLPSPGNCVSYDAATWPTVTINPYDAGSSVSLQGAASVQLPKFDFYYDSGELALGTYSAGSYDLTIPGGVDLGQETIPGALVAPAPIQVAPAMNPLTISPGDLASGLAVNLQGACSSPVVNVDVIDQNSNLMDSILCAYSAAGLLSIPPQFVSSYTNAMAFVMTIECVQETRTMVAGGASMTGIGRSTAIGVIFLQ